MKDYIEDLQERKTEYVSATEAPTYTESAMFMHNRQNYIIIAEELAMECGYTLSKLREKNREQDRVIARAAITVIILKMFPELTLREISSLFGMKHDMVIYYRKISMYDKLIKEKIEELNTYFKHD